jgi:hypothetical protein
MDVLVKPQMTTPKHLNKSTLGFVNGAIGIVPVPVPDEHIEEDPDKDL